MKKLLLGLCLFPLLCSAKAIQIPDTSVTFDAPDSFQPLTQEVMDYKWQSKEAPKWAIGTEQGGTTIAYNLKNQDISQAPLPVLKDQFAAAFDRVIPGIDWKKKDVVEINGQEWVYLEFVSNGLDADIYNIMLVAPYGKQMVFFNFNSVMQQFEQYESELRHSIETIALQ